MNTNIPEYPEARYEYVPFECPEVTEFIPEVPFFEEFQFQWDTIPLNPEAPDMSKGEYEFPLVRKAFVFGVEPLEMNHG